MNDSERVERFRGQVGRVIPRAVMLALDELPPATWEQLHRAFQHEGRVSVRAELAPNGVTVQVLCGWETDAPAPVHTFTQRSSEASTE